MENEMVSKTLHNTSITAFNSISSFLNDSLLSVFEIDQEIFLTCGSVFALSSVFLFVLYKVKDSNNKQLKYRSMIIDESEHKVPKPTKSSSNNSDYQRILNELHYASDNCKNIFCAMKCVQLTSNYPGLVNVKLHSDGVTPFHRVCAHGNQPLIELMLAKGADPEIKNVNGENALSMALYHYMYIDDTNFDCLDMLCNKGCYLNAEWYNIFLDLAIKAKNRKLAKWIIFHANGDKKNVRSSSLPPI